VAHRLGAQPALVSKADVPVFSQHEMIQERDAQKLAGLPKALGQDSIFLARRGITRRMVTRRG